MKLRQLGQSGLRVSEVCLGTMTFANPARWGASPDDAREMIDLYLARGGNFFDSANVYGAGAAETLVGDHLGSRRHQVVIGTKFGCTTQPDVPNAGGANRKSIVRALEASLLRLQTDYVDLFSLHVWDELTPEDEILRAFDDLISSGKVLYAGISDTPAWRVASMQATAKASGLRPFVALQIPHSLVERSVEAELIPMAQANGMAVTSWGPLAGGILSGKYLRGESGRAARAVNDRGLAISETVSAIADEAVVGPTAIAIAWLLQQGSLPILGARTPAQLRANLDALTVELSDDQLDRLDAVSAPQHAFPHGFLRGRHIQRALHGTLKDRLSL